MNSIFKLKMSKFRLLEPAMVQIVDIYPEYRYGWNDSENCYKTFVYFPDSCTADVVYNGDESARPKEGEKNFHLRLQEYDKEKNKFKFTKVGVQNREFFKLYKKVYDVDVALSKPCKIPVWDKERKQEVDVLVESGDIVRLIGFPATRIQNIAQSMMLHKGIEKVEVDVTDRLTGVVSKDNRLPFNWEDLILPKLVGKAFEFAVDGKGMDTKYSFREVTPFVVDNGGITINDIPF